MTRPACGPKEFLFAAGMFSFLLALYGLAALRGLDTRQNTILSFAYGALPLLSLPLWWLSLRVRRLLSLQAIFALAYISAYSALDWRTCAALGYCSSIASVVFMTIATPKVLLFLGVALASLAAFVAELRPKR